MIQNRVYPLTSVQREIWFDQTLHPDVPMYNIGGYVRIDGPVDPAGPSQGCERKRRAADHPA